MYELILNNPVVGLLKVAKKAGGQLFSGRGLSKISKARGASLRPVRQPDGLAQRQPQGVCLARSL